MRSGARASKCLAQGDATAARVRLENFPAELRARLEQEPAYPYVWSDLGRMEGVLGHKDEALRCARKAVELKPILRRRSFGHAVQPRVGRDVCVDRRKSAGDRRAHAFAARAERSECPRIEKRSVVHYVARRFAFRRIARRSEEQRAVVLSDGDLRAPSTVASEDRAPSTQREGQAHGGPDLSSCVSALYS